MHHQLSVLAANHHKHFFTEKPISLSTRDAEHVRHAVESSRVHSKVGFNLRFDPTFAALSNLLISGRIGRILNARIRGVARVRAWPSRTRFQYDIAAGGGVIFELGSHAVDLAMRLLGHKLKVSKVEHHWNPRLNVEDTATFDLVTPSKQATSIQLGWTENESGWSIHVEGDRGCAWANLGATPSVHLQVDAKAIFRNGGLQMHVPERRSSYQLELLHFAERIRDARYSLREVDTAIANLRILLEVKQQLARFS
jgi:predicted dehydrogenase